MKFLVDECLTRDVVERLTAVGHEAVHVGDLDLLGATDLEVMASAVESGRVVISADTDFGELLAKGGGTLPSVILLRRHHEPAGQAAAILSSMPDIEESLLSGAMVVITDDRVRIRSLRPIQVPGDLTCPVRSKRSSITPTSSRSGSRTTTPIPPMNGPSRSTPRTRCPRASPQRTTDPRCHHCSTQEGCLVAAHRRAPPHLGAGRAAALQHGRPRQLISLGPTRSAGEDV